MTGADFIIGHPPHEMAYPCAGAPVFPVRVTREKMEAFRQRWGDARADHLLRAGLIQVREAGHE